MPKPSRPALTAEFVRSIFDYDPDTGILTWKVRSDRSEHWNSRNAGKPAGSRAKRHLHVQIPKPQNYYVHVVVWLWMTGEWRPDEIDHRDGDGTNNRWGNLRIATYSQNGCNKAMQKNNKSGFVGVHFSKQAQRWMACINFDGVRVWRKGGFRTAEEAAQARTAVLPIYHGEFARLDH